MSIVISNLSKSYGPQKAVDNITFKVNKKEVVGFLGPNGAGKSTTMKIITGSISPDDGSVSVDGLDVRDQPIEIKKKIGYLPEHNPLYTEMFVREYLSFVAGIYQMGPARNNRISEVINLTGLTPEKSKKIGQLSKGYRQRVGLAAALLHDPEVIILDEPTSGLDPNQIVEIREVIRNLGKDKTVLFSSHILQEVENLCDRVVIINKGHIVADDNLSHLQSGVANEQIVLLEVGSSTDEEKLSEIDGVIGVERVAPNNYRLKTADAEQLKKNLFSYSLNKNLDIVAIRTEQTSLENIFRNLTANIQTN